VGGGGADIQPHHSDDDNRSSDYRGLSHGRDGTYDFYVYEDSAPSANPHEQDLLPNYSSSTAIPSESTEMEASSYSMTGSNAAPMDDFEESHDSASLAELTDDVTVDSTHKYMSGYRKSNFTINKLKAELAQTRNLLAMTKVNDIVILKNKLRSAEIDLNRVRVQNLEFKEKIEELELRLYATLRELDRRSQSMSDTNLRKGSESRHSAPPNATGAIASASTSVMQPSAPVRPEIDAAATKEFAENDARQLLRKTKYRFLSEDGAAVRIPSELIQHVELMVKKAVDAAVAADRKTIAELLKELHRAEGPEDRSGRKRVEVADKGTNTFRGLQVNANIGIDQPMAGKFVDSMGNITETRGASKGNQKSIVSYGAKDLLLSFFVGALLAIVGTILTIFISKSRGT
jgi:hypothetical protein